VNIGLFCFRSKDGQRFSVGFSVKLFSFGPPHHSPNPWFEASAPKVGLSLPKRASAIASSFSIPFAPSFGSKEGDPGRKPKAWDHRKVFRQSFLLWLLPLPSPRWWRVSGWNALESQCPKQRFVLSLYARCLLAAKEKQFIELQEKRLFI
jgi:hypothetical protein